MHQLPYNPSSPHSEESGHLASIDTRHEELAAHIEAQHDRKVTKEARKKCKCCTEVKPLIATPAPDAPEEVLPVCVHGHAIPLNTVKAHRKHLAEGGKQRRLVHLMECDGEGNPTGKLRINPQHPFRKERKKSTLRGKRKASIRPTREITWD